MKNKTTIAIPIIVKKSITMLLSSRLHRVTPLEEAYLQQDWTALIKAPLCKGICQRS